MDTEGFKELRQGPLGYSIEGPQLDMPAGFSECLENKLLSVREMQIVWPWRDGSGTIGRIRGTKDGSLLNTTTYQALSANVSQYLPILGSKIVAHRNFVYIS